MKVVIIGAGISGAASAYYLSKRGFDVEVWDPKGIAGGASGAAAGLLHLYAGIRSKRVEGSVEALATTEELLQVAGAGVILQRGLLRQWKGPRTERAFRLLAKRYDDVFLREDGIWIPGAYAIDCKLYCERLIAASGAKCLSKRAENLDIDADHIIVAAGWESGVFNELREISLSGVKGQMLRLEWTASPLPYALSCGGYLVMAPDQKSVLAGATFEHEFEDEAPTEDAIEAIRNKVGNVIKDLPVLEIRAGVRATTSNHKPIYRRISEKVSVITGLGSKGLLWHARLAKLTCDDIGSK